MSISKDYIRYLNVFIVYIFTNFNCILQWWHKRIMSIERLVLSYFYCLMKLWLTHFWKCPHLQLINQTGLKNKLKTTGGKCSVEFFSKLDYNWHKHLKFKAYAKFIYLRGNLIQIKNVVKFQRFYFKWIGMKTE